jgi:hypothetical protein
MKKHFITHHSYFFVFCDRATRGHLPSAQEKQKFSAAFLST